MGVGEHDVGNPEECPGAQEHPDDDPDENERIDRDQPDGRPEKVRVVQHVEIVYSAAYQDNPERDEHLGEQPEVVPRYRLAEFLEGYPIVEIESLGVDGSFDEGIPIEEFDVAGHVRESKIADSFQDAKGILKTPRHHHSHRSFLRERQQRVRKLSLERDAPGRRLEFILDFFLEFGILVPFVNGELPGFDGVADVFHAEAGHGVFLYPFPAVSEKLGLSFFVHSRHGRHDFVERDDRFFSGDPRYDHAFPSFPVAFAALDADGVSGDFPVGDFLSQPRVPEVEFDFAAGSDERSEVFSLHRDLARGFPDDEPGDFAGVFPDGFGVFLGEQRKDDRLEFAHFRRDYQPPVIRMAGNDAPDGTGGKPPGSIPRMGQCPVPVLVFHSETFHESLPEQMGRADLEGPSVAHHRFEGVSGVRSGEFFARRLPAGDAADGHDILDRLDIDLPEDVERERIRLGPVFMESVAFLPVEFGGSEERAGALFPSEHGYPLVVEHRQIPVGLEFVLEKIAEQEFGSRTDGERFFEGFPSSDGDDGEFRRESFHMVLFPFEKAHRDQHREIDVLDAEPVEFLLHGLLDAGPHGHGFRKERDAAWGWGILKQVAGFGDVEVPLGIVGRAGSDSHRKRGLNTRGIIVKTGKPQN